MKFFKENPEQQRRFVRQWTQVPTGFKTPVFIAKPRAFQFLRWHRKAFQGLEVREIFAIRLSLMLPGDQRSKEVEN